jgi:hypothetical protein
MNPAELMKYCRKHKIELRASTSEGSTIITFDNVMMVRTTETTLNASQLLMAATQQQIDNGMCRDVGADKCNQMAFKFDQIKSKCDRYDAVNTYLSLKHANGEDLRIFVVRQRPNTYPERYISLLPLVMFTYTYTKSDDDSPLYVKGAFSEALISPAFPAENVNAMVNVDYFLEEFV